MRSAVTKNLVLAALFAALTAVCSQIQIPLPMIPINLALFAVHLCGALLGAKWGALSMAVYALLGAIGVPVFAGFGSGPAVLFGKTGGYILGYILCAAIVGLLTRRLGFSYLKLCLSMVVGVAVWSSQSAFLSGVQAVHQLRKISASSTCVSRGRKASAHFRLSISLAL